jgi:hypothetical protein
MQVLLIFRIYFDKQINKLRLFKGVKFTPLKQLMRRLVGIKTLSIKGSGVFGMNAFDTHLEMHK